MPEQLLSMVADSLFDVGAIEPEWPGIGSAAQSDVDVGVIGIRVRDGGPLQAHA